MLRWIIFFIIIFLIDIYAFQAFRVLFKGYWLSILYFGLTLIILIGLSLELSIFNNVRPSQPFRAYILGAFIVILVPKLFVIPFLLVEDIYRLINGIFINSNDPETGFLPSRRKFISTIALSVAAIPFTSLLFGIFKGRYNYQVHRHTLEFEDLPEAFDGYTITQLSDLHCGSFDNYDKVKYGIDLTNAQNSDLIVLTGDVVNNISKELYPWKKLFSELKAKDGVYSILGNHDYGDYFKWKNSSDKIENFELLKRLKKEMGWKLLLNEHVRIKRGNEQIAVVGVENWGLGFIKKGDLNKASEGLSDKDFKVLLSHDPTHWQEEVKDNSRNFHLTLSGHTHGMQFGIEIPGFLKWSPAKWRYKYWAGMYEHSQTKRYLNVNRGFGYIAYPGRVGILPEITVIELRKKRKADS